MNEDQVKEQISGKFSELQDQAGNVSSKRLWAMRFGIAFFIESFIAFLLGATFAAVHTELPAQVVDLYKYFSLLSLSGCLTCLGLTLPEWFATKK